MFFIAWAKPQVEERTLCPRPAWQGQPLRPRVLVPPPQPPDARVFRQLHARPFSGQNHRDGPAIRVCVQHRRARARVSGQTIQPGQYPNTATSRMPRRARAVSPNLAAISRRVCLLPARAPLCTAGGIGGRDLCPLPVARCPLPVARWRRRRITHTALPECGPQPCGELTPPVLPRRDACRPACSYCIWTGFASSPTPVPLLPATYVRPPTRAASQIAALAARAMFLRPLAPASAYQPGTAAGMVCADDASFQLFFFFLRGNVGISQRCTRCGRRT